jgi:regulator of replication initiation timing
LPPPLLLMASTPRPVDEPLSPEEIAVYEALLAEKKDPRTKSYLTDYEVVLKPGERAKDDKGRWQRFCEKRNRNRDAAARSRNKKKATEAAVYEEVERLRVENQTLRDRVAVLEFERTASSREVDLFKAPPTPDSLADMLMYEAAIDHVYMGAAMIGPVLDCPAYAPSSQNVL